MKRVIILAMLALALASCAPDPRREADAYATRQRADALAASQAQTLEQDAQAHALLMGNAREASQFISTLMMTSMIAGMFTLFVSIVSLGIGLSIVFIGGGLAAARRNMLKPNQIRLDPVTRQYPLLITRIEEGKYSLSNPNTNSVTMLYDRNPADRMMIAAMSATQHAGALAYQARLSHQPGEIAQIQAPQILEVTQ